MPENREEESITSGKFRETKGIVSVLTKIFLALLPVFGTVFVTHIPEYLNIPFAGF